MISNSAQLRVVQEVANERLSRRDQDIQKLQFDLDRAMARARLARENLDRVTLRAELLALREAGKVREYDSFTDEPPPRIFTHGHD